MYLYNEDPSLKRETKVSEVSSEIQVFQSENTTFRGAGLSTSFRSPQSNTQLPKWP